MMLPVSGIVNLIRDPSQIDFNSPEIQKTAGDITGDLNPSNVMFLENLLM